LSELHVKLGAADAVGRDITKPLASWSDVQVQTKECAFHKDLSLGDRRKGYSRDAIQLVLVNVYTIFRPRTAAFAGIFFPAMGNSADVLA
jgi:hypothetical protein